ncbi:MAG: imidazoleglycerol-phosphate dehydratase HisB [Ardenticatenaceae bacterium]|nr:imidazoleglycerol-phosphate dehydratase HisB [Ardenticatenaceae bacterium]
MTRTASIQRQTSETDISISINLDGSGQHTINTAVGFFDHMLTAVSVHGLFDLTVQAKGDLHIDTHHTIEDVGIVFGQALNQALGDRKGIVRTAHAYVPMDEALGFVAIDLGGRPYTVFHGTWHTPTIGQMPTDLVQHFFESVAIHAKMNLHARIEYGRNDHHQAEALFKAFARALQTAVSIDPRRADVASTKGTLTE